MNKNEWYQKNKESVLKKQKCYRKTPMGRACHLISGYAVQDKRKGFEKSIDFDAKWIVDNIFSKPCPYCGETDWRKLGCNRINEDLPHTKDNVEPCCYDCNTKKLRMRKVYQYTLEGVLVKVWESLKEIRENKNYSYSSIQECLRGKRYSSLRKKWYEVKKANGYIWSYKPL